jgi:hypothetical protein
MRELTIKTPFTKEEVKEIEAELIPPLEKRTNYLKKQWLFTKWVFLFSAFLIATGMLTEFEKNHPLYLFCFLIICIPIAFRSIYLFTELEHINTNEEEIYSKSADRFYEIAVKQQDKPLALFLHEIQIQERPLTNKEERFLTDYSEELILKNKALRLKTGFNNLLH